MKLPNRRMVGETTERKRTKTAALPHGIQKKENGKPAADIGSLEMLSNHTMQVQMRQS